MLRCWYVCLIEKIEKWKKLKNYKLKKWQNNKITKLEQLKKKVFDFRFEVFN